MSLLQLTRPERSKPVFLQCNNLSVFLCSLLSCGTIFLCAPVSAETFFHSAFLSDDAESVADLSRFERGEGQSPGRYRVEVYLNDEYISLKEIKFTIRVNNNEKSSQRTLNSSESKTDDTGLQACLTPEYLGRLNINIQAIPALKKLASTDCVNLSDVVPMASTRFDFENQRLYISVPHSVLNISARGYIPPEEWDQGVNAFLLNYDFSGGNSLRNYNGGTQSNYFLSLNSGLNMGAWRLRNYSTWNYSKSDQHSSGQWQHISTYLQRTIVPLRAGLTLGDSYTMSDIFDGVGFRGIQLASDDNMLPDSLRGFAPTVRGIAKSNARVTVKQNGYVIYQTYVSPGAFEIADLYSTSGSGDLQVTITESDGTENKFSVPYSAVPVLQREGHVKYALTTGEYRNNGTDKNKSLFGQGTFIWGLPGGVTVYGGSQFTRNYKAFAFGSGVNLGQWGAASADITYADSTLTDGSRKKGESLRFLYAKSLNQYGTNFQLLGYRYSTQGFYTLNETNYRRMSGYTKEEQKTNPGGEAFYKNYYNLNNAKKGQLQVNIMQQLGKTGSVFLTGSRQTYWHSDQTNDLWQLGYNAFWNDISYSLTYSINKSPDFSRADKRLALNMSLPIEKWLSKGRAKAEITRSNHMAYATYAINTDLHGYTTHQAGGGGTLLDDNNLSYSIQQGYGNNGVGNSGSVSLNYHGGYGNSNFAYNYGRDTRQINYGVGGGLVAHANGITLSQPLGDTNVLIKAPGASGVNLENATGVRTDWRGYAIVPYASTYRLNRIALDTTTLKNNADIDNAVINVVPTQGALVRAEFDTRIGIRALITLLQSNGKPIPFGAVVVREDGKGSAIVGDEGQAYLPGLPLEGTLNVKWGQEINQSCKIKYTLPASSKNEAMSYAKAGCK